MPKYRSAIIGCGSRAYGHANAYQHVYRGELVACANRSDSARRQKFAETFAIPGYADAEQMLRAEKPDLVHLVTMPDQWGELMPMVSELRVPSCIVEKPIACGVADWRLLSELEAQTSTKFGVGKQFRWHPHLVNCQRAVQGGYLGRVLFLEFSCGMNIAAQGTHIIDWAMSLNADAPIVQVFGNASGAEAFNSTYPGPDATTCQVLFENGVHGQWNTGFTSRRVSRDSAIYKHCRVAAYGEEGIAFFEEFGNWGVETRKMSEYSMPISDAGRARNNDRAQAGLINAMFDWLEDDANPVGTHLTRALHQWNAVLGIYASALSHQPIDIPFDPPDNLCEELKEVLAQK